MDRLENVARSTAGVVVNGDAEFSGISIDTRSLSPGDAYVALRGANHDGHDFVRRAAGLGAAAAVVDHDLETRLPYVRVVDTLKALQQYASQWRNGFDIPLVGVTGSNGKTTVKQMLRSIFAVAFGDDAVLATRGNLNNHIGVPLTLLELRARHRAAVVEMGANHPGEIEVLAMMARPGIAIVTNAGDAHLEGFGDRQGVARAKGELFASLDAGAVAIVNADDDYAGYWRELLGTREQCSFGIDAPADFGAREIRVGTGEQSIVTHFTLLTTDGRHDAMIPMPGEHNVRNALAAAAAASVAGVDIEAIIEGLANTHGAGGRLELHPAVNGARVIDDSYNANPASVKAAVDVLTALPGELWMVLGDLAELGPRSQQLHEEIGRIAVEAGIDRLYSCGELGRHAVQAFGSEAVACDSQDELIEQLRRDASPETVILVKGSRSAGMEKVVQALVARRGEG